MKEEHVLVINEKSDPTIAKEVKRLFETYGNAMSIEKFRESLAERLNLRNPTVTIDQITIEERGKEHLESLFQGVIYRVIDGKLYQS